MILEIIVDDASTSTKTNYRVGKNDGYSLDFDLYEIFAFNQELNDADRRNLGKYLSAKWNLPYSTKIYALGLQTKELGRTYLLNKMNLREATTEEIARAKEGATEGLINAFTPTFQVGPNERPDKVNEYGFDTGSTTGFWVVPTQ